MTTARSPRRFDVGWFPIPGFLPFTVLIWAGYFAAIVGLTFAIDRWGNVEHSIWEQGTQPLRWGVMILGVWLVDTYLAVYVAHGVTRREFAERAGAFVVVFGALAGALMALGYVIEGLIFDAAGWSHELSSEQLYADTGDLGMVALTYTMVFAAWMGLGLLYTAALRRDDGGWGLLVLPFGFLPVVVTEGAVGGAYPSFLHDAVGVVGDPSVPIAVLVCLGCLLVTAVTAWGLLRDIPVAAKTS